MLPSPDRHHVRFLLPVLLFGWALTASAQFPDAPRAPLPPVAERRAAVLKEFDGDGDGLLSAVEREKARKAYAERMLNRPRTRPAFGPPPELLEEFDKNKDGEIDEDEGRVLQETMGQRFAKLGEDYDKNGNGRLDRDEIAQAGRDIDSGKLKGIPRMFLAFAGGPPGGGRGGEGPGEDKDDPGAVVRRADRDGDGKLSADELESVRTEWARIRAARAKAPGSNPSTTTP